jgi:hypothetical protein
MVELILIEIIAVPAERSRGRRHPRVVKRKMSSFPTKSRASPSSRQVFSYGEHIRVVAPANAPEHNVPPPIATPTEKPRQRPRNALAQATRCPAWLEHVQSWRRSGLSRATYCNRHGLNPCAFHHWVARARPSFRPKTRTAPIGP